MALSLVIGSSQSGKSTWVYNKIIEESMAHMDRKYLIIVPEQYTMATQKLLVAMHPNHCIMNIDVLAFNRLAYRVFEELGMETASVLDDTGKSLVIRKLVSDKIDELGALKNNMTRISYITQIKSLISELTQYNITPDKLREMIAYPPMSENFRRKASDLLVMYEAFLEFIDGRYLTTESVLSRLNQVVEDSDMVAGATMVFDGFTGFTPIQNQLVEHLMGICQDMYVCITADDSTALTGAMDEDSLFKMSGDFFSKMNLLAKRAGIGINEPVFIDRTSGWLKDNPVMLHLEANLFRTNHAAYDGKDAAETIELYSLKDPRQELKLTAIKIRQLVKEKGMRYGDFALVTPVLDTYRYLIDSVWADYNIPYFIDAKSEIAYHPFSEAIDAAFDIISSGFRRDHLFRFLRTGMTDLSREDIDNLENYVIATGIRGSNRYFKPFTARCKTFSTDESLEYLNGLREAFIGPFMDLYQAMSKGEHSVRDMAIALYNFIVAFNCREKLQARGQIYEQDGNRTKAMEYEKIYSAVMKLLDKMVAILGDEVMDLDQFSQIYKAGLSATTIGQVPFSGDCVIVGDVERTRISNVKVLFLLGASDDTIPKKVENGGILSSLEREQLLENGAFELAPSDRQKSFRQRFYLYMMLTKPSCKLFITSPRTGQDGKAARPSYLMESVEKTFGLRTVYIEDFAMSDRLLSKKEATELLTELIHKAKALGLSELKSQELTLLDQLIAWASTSEKEQLNRILEAAFYRHEPSNISKEVMEAVNGAFNLSDMVKGSVTKFETYAKCSYRYFLTYVLGLQEREEFTLSSLDIGSFCHDILKKFSDGLKNDHIRWADATADQLKSHIDTAISQGVENLNNKALLEDATFSHVLDKLKETMTYTVAVIVEQVKRGTFEPSEFELRIVKEIADQDGNPIAQLRGSVDRIDIADSVDSPVRIIDYKSSDRNLSLQDCYYGLSLQLPIYMKVALESLQKKYPQNLHPAAMLYYTTTDDMVETAADKKRVDSMRFVGQKMQGLLTDDQSDLAANDSTVGLEEGQSLNSEIVPYKLTTKGTLDGRGSKTVSREDMEVMLDFALFKAGDLAAHILKGDFDACPAKVSGADPCLYCNYKSVCRFNDKVEGFKARKLMSLKDDEATQAMKDQMKGIGDKDNGAD